MITTRAMVARLGRRGRRLHVQREGKTFTIDSDRELHRNILTFWGPPGSPLLLAVSRNRPAVMVFNLHTSRCACLWRLPLDDATIYGMASSETGCTIAVSARDYDAEEEDDEEAASFVYVASVDVDKQFVFNVRVFGTAVALPCFLGSELVCVGRHEGVLVRMGKERDKVMHFETPPFMTMSMRGKQWKWWQEVAAIVHVPGTSTLLAVVNNWERGGRKIVDVTMDSARCTYRVALRCADGENVGITYDADVGVTVWEWGRRACVYSGAAILMTLSPARQGWMQAIARGAMFREHSVGHHPA